MRRIAILMAFSVLAACQTVPRPDADVCTANASTLHQKCFNLKHDYDDNGQLKPGAKAHYLPCPVGEVCSNPEATHYKDEAAMLAALHKSTVFTPDSWAEVKAWIKELRQANREGD